MGLSDFPAIFPLAGSATAVVFPLCPPALTNASACPTLPASEPMAVPSPQSFPDKTRRTLVVVALAALWLQLYLSVIPVWRFGEYYNYGWFVPPLAAFFFYRRWRDVPGDAAGPAKSVKWVIWLAVLLLPVFALLRALNYVDAAWRPPMLANAAIVVVASHVLVGRFLGWKISWFFAPVTIFALSAIPWPWQIEQAIIRNLTKLVVSIASELFNLYGRPVSLHGEQLESMGVTVSVTNACSGIRSFQNLMMASLFFGEMFLLRFWPRVLLIGVGIASAIVVNIARAMTLAAIRFDQGETAFEHAHDSVGYTAFAIASLILFAVAATCNHFRWKPRGKLVVQKVDRRAE